MPFRIPYGRDFGRNGRIAGGFNGMPPLPLLPSRASSNPSAQVHPEMHDDTGAYQQPSFLRREILRSGSHVEPAAGVHREGAGPDGNLMQAPASPAWWRANINQDVAGYINMSVGMGDTASQGPAKRRGLRAGVRTRAYRAWKATQQG